MVSFLEEKKREREKNLTAHFFFLNPCCDFYLISIFFCFGNKKLTFLFEFVFFLFIGLKDISKVL